MLDQPESHGATFHFDVALLVLICVERMQWIMPITAGMKTCHNSIFVRWIFNGLHETEMPATRTQIRWRMLDVSSILVLTGHKVPILAGRMNFAKTCGGCNGPERKCHDA